MNTHYNNEIGINQTSTSISADAYHTHDFNMWSSARLININESVDKIELVYEQFSLVHMSDYNNLNIPKRVYKVIISVKDGKLHKSEPIFAEIIPAQKETYKWKE